MIYGTRDSPGRAPAEPPWPSGCTGPALPPRQPPSEMNTPPKIETGHLPTPWPDWPQMHRSCQLPARWTRDRRWRFDPDAKVAGAKTPGYLVLYRERVTGIEPA